MLNNKFQCYFIDKGLILQIIEVTLSCFTLALVPFRYIPLKFNRPGQIAPPTPSVGRAQARKTSETRPIFLARKFCLVKKEKSLDLQIYKRIGKTMKKL